MEKQLRYKLGQLLDNEQFDEARKVIDETLETANWFCSRSIIV